MPIVAHPDDYPGLASYGRVADKIKWKHLDIRLLTLSLVPLNAINVCLSWNILMGFHKVKAVDIVGLRLGTLKSAKQISVLDKG